MIFLLIFIAKTLMPMKSFCFAILWMFLILIWNFMSLKSSFLAKSLLAFASLAWWWFAGFKHLTIIHLKHSLSSIFWILINPFLGWFNSLDNFIELLPAKGLYFEILIVWLMTEKIIQPKTFPKDFCMFVIIVD